MMKNILILFSVNLVFTTLWGFIEHKKLIEWQFIVGFSILMTVIILLSSYLPDPPRGGKKKASHERCKKKENVIIPRPPRWMYVHDGLKNNLPDDLIRLTLNYMYIGDSNMDFKTAYL